MKRGVLIYSTVLCLIFMNVYAGDNLKENLKKLVEQKRQGQKVVIDNSLRREIYDFLSKNPNVPIKAFKKWRLAYFASETVLDDLDERYNTTAKDYQTKIKDREDRNIYRIALKKREEYYYKAFYACKGSDEKKVKESWEKVDKLRDQISAILRKDASLRSSNEIIKLEEQIFEECRFEGAEYSLLYAYRDRGEKDEKYRKKFNDLMLRMIADDQINYDYLYKGLDSLNTGFVGEYLLFFTNVNSLKNKLILSKDQVRFIAETILDKHREVFNLRNYYSEKTGRYDEYAVSDAIQSMVNLSTWLRHYKLDDLNERIIKKFFDDEFVMRTMRYTPWFKAFWEYLVQREDFQKYKEEQ